MTCQDSFHEVAFNISFWTRNISSARILFWRGVLLRLFLRCLKKKRKYFTSYFSKSYEFSFNCVTWEDLQRPTEISPIECVL